ncbi:SH3 domain-containing protein [Colletotrichum siamense]|uniref:SH3 domain-containing protein n=1 Tax=Colletotrichum siamense TaxID=690259 RepID=A0A9P5EQU2_COLSI|nr:SH3 domain-containing protein [Colletotrichum siamense]KAF4857708.1 SH3 domain-containing protein [Colletotrichum siamense]
MSWSGPSHSEKPPVPTGEHQQQTFPPPPTDQKTELAAGQQGQQPYFPPPPPGPPPANQPQYTHAPQTQQPQYGAPPQQQQQQQYAPPPAQQHQADYNPAQYGGAGHHYTPPGADHTDPAASQAAAAFAATAPEATKPQKQHKGWGERLTQIGMKAAGPINAMANKMGSQSFLPTTMDKECEKAAKILQSFCKEGIASDVPPQQQQPASEKLEPGKTDASGSGSSRPVTPNKAKKEQKAIVKIPSKVINKAVGLAIFTTFRAGFQFSGATGSGVLIARLPDGSWGPPSGIQVHAVGAGFMIGADIHDTVLIINSREALNAFLGNRVSLGSDVAVVAGPYGAGGVMDVGASFGGKTQKEGEQKAADEAAAAAAAAAKPADDGKLKPEDDKKAKRRSSSTSLKPNFSYVKSRGFYAGVQVDGTVVTERKDANAAFYGQKVSVDQIIKGQVPPQGPAGQWPGGAHLLYEALRTAEAQQPLPEANLPPPAPVPATGPVPTTSPGQAPPGYGQQSPPGYGQPPQGYGQYPQGGPLGSHPPQSGPTASGALGDEQLPGYVEDNVPRPGVGDHKQQYQ